MTIAPDVLAAVVAVSVGITALAPWILLSLLWRDWRSGRLW